MKDFVKSTKFKVSLLCLGMVIIGVGIGMFINNEKTIPTLEDGSEVIAEIDGKQFTADDLFDQLKNQGGETVLTNMVDEYIASIELEDTSEADDYADSYLTSLKSQYETYGEDFATALASAGYDNENDFKKLVAKDKLKQLVAEKFIKQNKNNKYFSQKDIKKYYDESITGSMNARYILIKPDVTDGMTDDEKNAAEDKALATANEVIEKLKDGEDFADLAKEYSDDTTTASEGGLYNGFTKSDVVEEFWNSVENLKDGKYTTSPVKSSYGYFVISRISQEDKPSLEDSNDEIMTALLSKLETSDTDTTSKAWIEIRKNYNLNIIDSNIKKTYDETIKTLNSKKATANANNTTTNTNTAK